MRKKILAANWKMNKTIKETTDYLESFLKVLAPLVPGTPDVEVVIAPPFIALESASRCLASWVPRTQNVVKLCAQNMNGEENGAFTGEISASMLQDVGCEYVILGHSERRHHFGESDDMVQKKIHQAIEHHLRVIFCIGETFEEREQEKTHDVLKRQITLGLKGVSREHLSFMVMAYEPVWAIGTGKHASASQAEEAHKFIRKTMWDLYGMDLASHVSILYGGSVKPDNFKETASQPNVDGALVGGASLNPKTFIEILNQMK